MSVSIKKHPNGYAVIVEPEDVNIFKNISDYDEYLGNAFSSSSNVSDYFSSKNDFFNEVSQTFEDYQENIGEYLKGKFERSVKEISGTHLFDLTDTSFWDVNANKLYQEMWKPVVEAHLDFIKKADTCDFEEFVENLDDSFTTDNFPFIKGLKLDLNSNGEYFPESERKKWVEKLTERLAEYESGVTVSQLDDLIDLYMYGYNYIYNWNKFSMIPDPDYFNRYEKTIVYYLENNPFIVPVVIQDGHYSVTVHTCSELHNCNAFMFLDNAQLERDPQGLNQLKYLNNVLEGNFYSADLVFLVPEKDKHLYPECEYSKDLKSWAILNIESCGFILNEDEALNYYDYIAEQPPYDPVYNYSTLGQVTKI